MIREVSQVGGGDHNSRPSISVCVLSFIDTHFCFIYNAKMLMWSLKYFRKITVYDSGVNRVKEESAED